MKTEAKKIFSSGIKTMPAALVRKAIAMGVTNPSPYNRYGGGSYYNTPNKSWEFTPGDTVRVSDHWNFISRGETHCRTDIPVPSGTWAIGHYCAEEKIYKISQIFEKNKAKLKANGVDPLTQPLRDRLYARLRAQYDAACDDVRRRNAEITERRDALMAKLFLKNVRLKMSLREKMQNVITTMQPSGYKMGDRFELTCGDVVVVRDCREYYSGRGAKYNATVRHGDIRECMSKAKIEKIFRETFEEKLKKEKIQKSKEFQKSLKKFDLENPTLPMPGLINMPKSLTATVNASSYDGDYDNDYDNDYYDYH